MSKFCYQEVFFSFFLLFTPHPPKSSPLSASLFPPTLCISKTFFFFSVFPFFFFATAGWLLLVTPSLSFPPTNPYLLFSVESLFVDTCLPLLPAYLLGPLTLP